MRWIGKQQNGRWVNLKARPLPALARPGIFNGRAILLSSLLVATAGLAYGLSSHSTSAASPPVTFIGAGDIAESLTRAEATAKVLDTAVAADPSTVVWTAGDNTYPNGTASEFSSLYQPTWGRHRDRTRPTPGNHDYLTANASGYYNYFCPTAATCRFPGGTQQRYYSYDIGNWHIIGLNSEIEFTAGSPQLTWLQQDLAANPGKCLAAVWHKPYFNSGTSHGRELAMRPFWDALYNARADVILNGHEHVYERYDKQTPDGVRSDTGIRQFTAGTGGAGLNSFGTLHPNSRAQGTVQGALKLTLNDTGYSWQFMPVAGQSYSDSGTETCNNTTGDAFPTVNITAPSANAVVSGSSVSLTANASDNNSVAGVQFKADGANVGAEDTASPYGVTWNTTGLSEGQHTITAVARDSAGQTTTSVPVTVTVDNVPDTTAAVDVRVAASADDAEQNSNASPVLTSTDLELVTDASVQTVGMRFNNVTVPRGAVITNAYVQFATDETSSGTTALNIRAEANNSAAAFTTASNNVSNRPRTTASANWSPPAWNVLNEAGAGQRTPNLAAIVSEVTGRSGWNSGNSLALIVTGSGRRNAHAWDGSAGQAPLLHIDYQLDRSAPSVPTGLSATAVSSSQINLSWSPSTDDTAVAGYRIYRNGTQIATTAGTSYANTGLTASTAYSYTVAAYDTSGNVSAQTAAANATTPAGSTAPQTLVFNTTADATVKQSSGGSNSGTATFLEIDNSPVMDFLMKFNVTIPAGKTVTSAKLRLYNIEASVSGGRFYRTANTSWTETGVTWNNAPAPDASPFATLGSVATNTWYEVTVPAANVAASGTYGFRVKTTNSDGADYRSREGGSSTIPQLVLVVQ